MNKTSVIENRTAGFSSFQLKVIALVCMTLDHLAAYGYEISIFARFDGLLRSVGRVAAPLFLFVFIQSVRHTRDKRKFLLRLYTAGVCTGLFEVATNLLLGNFFGIHISGNIIFTFFYVAVYAYLIEKFLAVHKSKKRRSAMLIILLLVAVSLIPSFIRHFMDSCFLNRLSPIYRVQLGGLRDSLVPSALNVEYGAAFVILGVILYFAKTKWLQCGFFGCFCLLCVCGAFLTMTYPELFIASSFASTYFHFRQCFMIFALPFMSLYNGQPGKKCKWFFYWYYPVHRYLISVIAAFF